MRKISFVFIVASLFCLRATAQSCLPDGIQFQTQGQIDSFSIHYPGCKFIEGSVSLSGTTITNLNGLSNVRAIKYDLNINNVPNLTSLHGLENLDSLERLIIYTSDLENLTGLNSLCTFQSLIIGFQAISNPNPSFVSLEGMPKMTKIGGVSLYGTHLTDLSGLEHLVSADYIDVYNNPDLLSLNGLNHLDSVSNHLLIRWNSKLLNLEGLENLVAVGGDLGIWQNPSLTTLEGMSHLVSVGAVNEAEGMNIFNNPLLSACSITGVCEHLSQRPSTSFIAENAPGCATNTEVEAQCQSPTKNPPLLDALRIFPNPNSGFFTVEMLQPAKSGMTFRITDLAGRLLHAQKTEPGSAQQTVQANELPNGLYFLQVMVEGKVLAVEKFVKH